ncbi:MAG: DUF1109 family protein [Burkholderiaceae bacterium]|nr:DUF1109 family protein [Burkholderiaceae bacterium]
MRTEDLVRLLARGEVAADPRVGVRGFSGAAGWGAFGAVLLMAVFLGVRPDLQQAVLLPMFWLKLGFALSIAACALIVAFRLALPGRGAGRALWGIGATLAIIWTMGVAGYAGAEPSARLEMLLGQTWRWCPLLIAGLSLPAFGTGLWAMRTLAPANLRRAGAGLGFAAGAIGATAYSLHCPELAAAFIGVWYVIGMLIPTVAGALLGPWILRW